MLCRMLLQDFGIASTAFKFGIELEFYLEPRSMIYDSWGAVAAKVGELMRVGGLQVTVAEKDENKC
jgi:hypothetical protein